jgi:site-specific DNA-methyltransferase (adenine-specific)
MSESKYNPDVLSCLANLSNDEVFTPPNVVNNMLDMLPKELFEDKATTFLDIGTKSGVFLREIAKRLIKGLESEIPDLQKRVDHILHKQLFGIATTELTSLVSRRTLYCSKYPNCRYSASLFDTVEGNIRFRAKKHDFVNGRCKWCGASVAQFDRDDGLESHAYEFIHTDKPEEIFNMKFDVIVGNPPYQLADGGAQASATPIYNLFVQQAKKLNPRYLVMIIPARWYTGGKGLDEFRKEMINDKHISIIHDYPKASDCFPSVEIKGGVCYFLRDEGYDNYENEMLMFNHDGEECYQMRRKLKYPGFDVFIRDARSVSILNKILKLNFESLSSHVSTRKPFGLPGEFVKSDQFHPTDRNLNWPLKCYGKGMSIGYVEKKNVRVNNEYIDRWKVFVPRANNIGMDTADDNQNSFVGKPGEISTESYMTVCADLDFTEQKCNNLAKYLRTKFARFCHCLMKASQDATAKTYSFVPMQDFSKPWVDEELYKKYNLTADEIKFIESMIKPME